MQGSWLRATAVAVALVGYGCALVPRGTADEHLRVAAAGTAWDDGGTAPRALPALPEDADWRQLLAHAFLANGDLEAAWLDWRAAVARVDAAASYPNTNLALGYEYMFSGENLKAWDRTTLTVGADPMQNLAFPTKVMAAGRVALAEARATGDRFAALKFELQKRVLTAWLEWVLTAEHARLARETAAILAVGRDAAARTVATGGMQAELAEAEAAYALAEDEAARRAAELGRRRAMLNALVGRPVEAPLAPPAVLPAARPLPVDDDALLAIGTTGNPELGALAHDIARHDEAVGLARQQWIPDLNPFAGFTGSIEQVAGLMASIPVRIPMILAGIREARTILQRARATARQTTLDRQALFAATLLALRDAERQVALLDGRVLPLAAARVRAARTAYEAGELRLGELLAAERMPLELRGLLAEARIARETRLAELEALAGVDVERMPTRVAAATAAVRTEERP